MKKFAVIVGTRPEAIKLAPVILGLQKAGLETLVCNTGQHEKLCGETLAFFGIREDLKLDVMRSGQELGQLQGRLLAELDKALNPSEIQGALVQGDTMSAFCGAISAFYKRLPVFHVEAGLRSGDPHSPFPEEALRQMLARVASLHFAPTEKARANLLAENIPACKIHVTGNTVVDALQCVTCEVRKKAEQELEKKGIFAKKLVLVTVHRRENHGSRLLRILEAVTSLTMKHRDCLFLIPVHPNPNVRRTVHERLSGIANILLTEPLNYPQLVAVLARAWLAISDSGGIQEEAPAFGLPLLVLRNETERQEGIQLGLAKLVGADPEQIIACADSVLGKKERWDTTDNPYGDGFASQRIVELIRQFPYEGFV